MKKNLIIACTPLLLSLLPLTSCNETTSLLDPNNPVTLSMWHVYGEQADSPMNQVVDEFNSTLGAEKGIVINVTLMSNASQIGDKLLAAQEGKAGVPSMPDLFFCHGTNAKALGIENLIDWKEEFSEEELSGFVSSFLKDGTVEESLAVLPVSKSTHLLFLAGGAFERFASAKGINEDSLKTWDGFFDVAETYYDYSGGKPFCALDYLLRSVELNAISHGAKDFYNEEGWYKDDELILSTFKRFASSLSKGHIVVSDLYSNTQVMTGQTIAGISSSAASLYYNDKITYPDNTSEDTNLKVLPLPQEEGLLPYATQAGVGLCAYKSNEQKEEACATFAKWFTEEKRNLDFVAKTGYMPVKIGAFEKLSDFSFASLNLEKTFMALKATRESCSFLSEPSLDGYYQNTYSFYDSMRTLQKQLSEKYASGESASQIEEEILELFKTAGK